MPHPLPSRGPTGDSASQPAVLKMDRQDGLLGVLAAALYGAVGLFMVLNGALNVDEGFYGLAARAGINGSLPYRDFSYTQMPLFPYVQGAVMKLIGFGFIEMRLASGLWAALTIAVGSVWLWRRFGRVLGFGYAVLMVCGLQWMYFAHIGKTSAFSGFLLLTTVVVLLGKARFAQQILWISLLGVVCVGCRLTVAPFFVIVWTGLLLRNFSARNLGRALAWPALFTLILIVPFIAADPKSFWFWAVDIHGASRAVKNWHLDLPSLFPLAPALCILELVFVCCLLSGRLRLRRPVDLALLGLFVTLASNVLPTGAYPEYPAPLVPSLLLAFGVLFAEMRVPRKWQVALITLCSLINLSERAPLDFAIYGEARQAAAFVRRFQQPGFPFVGGASIVALEAGSPVDNRMVMAPFCCTESFSEAEATKRRLITPGSVAALMADPRCDVIVMSTNPAYNLVWSVPEFKPISTSAIARWKAVLSTDFALEQGYSNFVVFVRRSLYSPQARNWGAR